MERELDNYLAEWAKKRNRKPLLLRGARQTGKSHAVEKLGSAFGNYICINFEKTPSSGDLFVQDLDHQFHSESRHQSRILPVAVG